MTSLTRLPVRQGFQRSKRLGIVQDDVTFGMIGETLHESYENRRVVCDCNLSHFDESHCQGVRCRKNQSLCRSRCYICFVFTRSRFRILAQDRVHQGCSRSWASGRLSDELFFTLACNIYGIARHSSAAVYIEFLGAFVNCEKWLFAS